MHATHLFTSLVAIVLLAPLSAALANPPAHAPAHGYRAKAEKPRTSDPAPRKGIEVIFDSERGIYVGVRLPDIVFHQGRYYREREGRWEVSLTGDEGWRVSASGDIPTVVVESKKRKKHHPGPARKK
jgi:hypothetical protein